VRSKGGQGRHEFHSSYYLGVTGVLLFRARSTSDAICKPRNVVLYSERI